MNLNLKENTMNTRIAIAIAIAVFSTSVAAQQDKRLMISGEDNRICKAGSAMTWTVQCDPGSRRGLDRLWNPPGPGVEICRATMVGCRPIDGFNPQAEAGFEVQQSPAAGSLTSVTFGLGRLLGDEQ